MKGRKPAPTYLKLVKNVRPNRINRAEGRPPRGIPSPPPHLSDEAKKEWARVARDLYDAGILTELDRSTLAAYCTAWGRWVQAERLLAAVGLTETTTHGNLVQHPILGIARRAAHDVVRYAAELGMTPSSRSRVAAVPPPNDDPTDVYFR